MSKLMEDIGKYREGFNQSVPKDIQAIIQGAIEGLEASDISSSALKVGDKVENFTLSDALGKNVTLYKELESNDFVVINFYRGVWCPYCNLELKAFHDINPKLKSLNTSLMAISPQTPDSSLSTKEKNELSFHVLSDVGNKVAQKFGLTYALPDEIYELLKQMGTDLESYNGDNTHSLPIPATYIINKNKEVIYSFAQEDYRKREEPQTILDIIRKNS